MVLCLSGTQLNTLKMRNRCSDHATARSDLARPSKALGAHSSSSDRHSSTYRPQSSHFALVSEAGLAFCARRVASF